MDIFIRAQDGSIANFSTAAYAHVDTSTFYPQVDLICPSSGVWVTLYSSEVAGCASSSEDSQDVSSTQEALCHRVIDRLWKRIVAAKLQKDTVLMVEVEELVREAKSKR